MSGSSAPHSLAAAPGHAATPGQAGVVLALGATQTLAWASSTYLPAILAAPMARDLDVSRATVFGAFSVSLLVMAAAGPVVGRVIDRAGGRHMLMWSNLVFAAGLCLLGVASHVSMLFAAWCVLGAGMAMGLYDAAFAALVRIYGTDARKPITGITLIAGFASTVGWPLSAFMDAEIGWRGACFAWAGLHLCLALPMNWRLIPAVALAAAEPPASLRSSTPADVAASVTPEPKVDAIKSAITGLTDSPPTGPTNGPTNGEAARTRTAASTRSTEHTTTGGAARSSKPRVGHADSRERTFFWLAVYFAATAFVTSAYAAHLPGLLGTMGAGSAGALFAAALLGPAQVAARLVEFGVISRYRVHALTTARVATALHPFAVVLLLVFGGAPAWAALFVLLHGAGNGMITIAKGTLPLALFGPLGYGLTQGWLGVGARVTQAGAPFLFGLVLEQFGGGASLLLSGLLGGISVLALFMLHAPDATGEHAAAKRADSR